MTTEQERILERVRKMMRLAKDSGATEGERDNALRMAHATLAKYNLDMAQAETETKKPTAGEARVKHAATFYGRPWARAVAGAAADLCFCSYLYLSAKRAKDTGHLFVGRTSNAITAAELARYLVESITREARRYQRDTYAGNEAFRAFGWGAASAIRKRVAEIRAAAEKPQPDVKALPGASTALVAYVADESKANLAFIAEAFPVLHRGRNGKGISDVDAHASGRSYGSTVSLNRQLN